MAWYPNPCRDCPSIKRLSNLALGMLIYWDFFQLCVTYILFIPYLLVIQNIDMRKNPVAYFPWSISNLFLYLFFKLPLERRGNWKFWLLAQLPVVLKSLAICSSFFSITASKTTSLFFKSSFLGKERGHRNVKHCQQKVVSCPKYKVVIVIFQIQSHNVSTENPNLLLVEIEQHSSVFL